MKISVGDTPSCILVDKLHGIEEMRPGNFVFFDVMQTVIGSCTDEEIALALACPVVAKDSSRNILVVYGGGVHLSKESVILYDGTEIFGRIALPSGKTWGKKLENCYVSSLSQEHGLVTVTKEVFNVISEGELIFILPVHSCLTADLMQGYRLPNGSAIDHMSAKIFKSSK